MRNIWQGYTHAYPYWMRDKDIVDVTPPPRAAPPQDPAGAADGGAAPRERTGLLHSAKMGIILFLIFFLINSLGFIDSVLGLFPGAVARGSVTAKGTAVQGLFLVLLYALATAMDRQEII